MAASGPTHQRDTHLGPADAERRYRYEGLESGFTTEVGGGERGLVVDHPRLFGRVD